MQTLGVCIGSSNISMVVLEKNTEGFGIKRSECQSHEGNPGGALAKMLGGSLLQQIKGVAITGRKLKN